jgi:hypothetical protein
MSTAFALSVWFTNGLQIGFYRFPLRRRERGQQLRPAADEAIPDVEDGIDLRLQHGQRPTQGAHVVVTKEHGLLHRLELVQRDGRAL